MKKTIILIGMIGIAVISCKKKGCTDDEATNFDIEAKKDDGSCVYSKTPTDTTGTNPNDTTGTSNNNQCWDFTDLVGTTFSRVEDTSRISAILLGEDSIPNDGWELVFKVFNEVSGDGTTQWSICGCGAELFNDYTYFKASTYELNWDSTFYWNEYENWFSRYTTDTLCRYQIRDACYCNSLSIFDRFTLNSYSTFTVNASFELKKVNENEMLVLIKYSSGFTELERDSMIYYKVNF